MPCLLVLKSWPVRCTISGCAPSFGLPGGENVRILDALRDRGIEFVLVRNESSAAYAASARWTLTGELQACLTTLGPGITHAAAGVGHLWLDRAGVVVISACTAEGSGPMHTHQVLDQEHLLAPMVKAHIRVAPDNVHSVRDVCALAAEGRPGPVYVQMSNEVAGRAAGGGGGGIDAEQQPRPRRSPDAEGVAQALALMARAHRPVVVVGLGARDASLREPVQAVADSLQAPIVATPKAKGIVPDSHPLAAGVIGPHPNRPGLRTSGAGGPCGCRWVRCGRVGPAVGSSMVSWCGLRSGPMRTRPYRPMWNSWGMSRDISELWSKVRSRHRDGATPISMLSGRIARFRLPRPRPRAG